LPAAASCASIEISQVKDVDVFAILIDAPAGGGISKTVAARFTIRTTDQRNVVRRHNGAVVGYFSLAEAAKAEAQKRVPGILRGE
jgi:hypothetical protein